MVVSGVYEGSWLPADLLSCSDSWPRNGPSHGARLCKPTFFPLSAERQMGHSPPQFTSLSVGGQSGLGQDKIEHCPKSREIADHRSGGITCQAEGRKSREKCVRAYMCWAYMQIPRNISGFSSRNHNTLFSPQSQK